MIDFPLLAFSIMWVFVALAFISRFIEYVKSKPKK
jgi:hypothetical protein